jgi:aryl-alcohol dehydrogenase-like predicted oxidoreductase
MYRTARRRRAFHDREQGDYVKTRRIGSLEVSAAGLGCSNFGAALNVDEKASAAVVSAALEAGVTFFDTAESYADGRSEEYLGRALGRHRDEVVISTKFGYGVTAGGSARYITRAVDASLARLGTDRIDLYCLHGPDLETPIDETLYVLEDLIKLGKVREIGCSTFAGFRLKEAASAANKVGLHAFAAVVHNYSLLDRSAELEVLPVCARLDIKLIPYWPLAMGVLTGNYRRGETPTEGRLATMPATVRKKAFTTDQQFARVERLEDYARAHGHSLLEVALSWLAANTLVASVIAGATSPEQVRANAAATNALTLGPTERTEIEALVE